MAGDRPSKKASTADRIDETDPAEKPGDKTAKGSNESGQTPAFPIVGLGASAGGLKPLKAFFANLPEKSGMAFVVVIHMAAKQPSMLAELLQKTTKVALTTVRDGETIQPDHIYVCTPDKQIGLSRGALVLTEPDRTDFRHPIDLFFKSLARDRQVYAAGVILSGTGTDGTAGIREIKAQDGLVLVQSPDSADYDGMPASAIDTRLVDRVLPPEQMPEALKLHFGHYLPGAALEATPEPEDGQKAWLNEIFDILQGQVGHDFSAYKTKTLLRRVNRRMGLNRIESQDKYLRFLSGNPAESQALFQEMLIGVTSFFRDPESFAALERVLPDLLAPLASGDALRIWVPGCSTGEEVYSLAMIFSEALARRSKPPRLQLFGTDVNSRAIDRARQGLYPDNIAADVDSGRLSRFFSREGSYYRVAKRIRESVVFAEQDLLKDPPFSRLRMICCRNLLIYLNVEAQRRLLPLFYYTLNTGGVLMLGSSESIGPFSTLFKTLDKKWKIHRRRDVARALEPTVYFPNGRARRQSRIEKAPPSRKQQNDQLAYLTRSALLEQFTPTAVLTDAKGNVLHIQGRTGKYLEAVSGPPAHNILDLSRQGLRIELSSAIRAAATTGRSVTRKQVAVKTNGARHTIDLHVRPQHGALTGRLLIVFDDVAGGGQAAADATAGEPSRPDRDQLAALENELNSTRENHQTAIEELESSNEELQSTNEELQSANEELQSTNEELESSKEELQSLNEELQTVNAELQSKLDELFKAQDDMRNLLNSTQIATIFVDNDLCVKRFTEGAGEIVNLIRTDIGRPLHHVASNLTHPHLAADIAGVIERLESFSAEVQTHAGKWFKMHIMPYRTADNRIDGAVLTFAPIQEQKKTQAVLETARHEMQQALLLVRRVFDMNPDPLAVLDEHCTLQIANRSFGELFDMPAQQAEGLELFALREGLLQKSDLKARLDKALADDRDFELTARVGDPSDNGRRFHIQGQIFREGKDIPYRLLLSFRKD